MRILLSNVELAELLNSPTGVIEIKVNGAAHMPNGDVAALYRIEGHMIRMDRVMNHVVNGPPVD